MIKRLALTGALLLAGCARPDARVEQAAPAPQTVELQILAINDFHGNLEPPKSATEFLEDGGAKRKEALGGVAYIAGTLAGLRQGQRNTVTVSAGDLIGASPFASANFLDEPTVLAMDMLGLEYNAVGNHEFDRGSAELLRMQKGGCDKFTTRQPCQVNGAYPGAKFRFLAANVEKQDGSTIFPGTAIKDFGPIQLGIIGMTLKETASLVTPAGVAGLRFADEAATANALVPQLKAQGADLIMLVIHQGGRSEGVYNVTGCPGLRGDILPILEALEPAISLVVSGHTHEAYACERPASDGSRRLLTSGGRYGGFVSDIRLQVDLANGQWLSASARNVPVVRAVSPDPKVQALVDRYVAAAAPAAARVVGTLSGPALHGEDDDETAAANLIADAQLGFTRASEKGGAQIAFMNGSGVRTDLVPDSHGQVRYGQVFEMQPFGNGLVVLSLTGNQLRRMLEQQFTAETYEAGAKPSLMVPSEGFAFEYDLSRPRGERVTAIRLNGRSIDSAASYRVTVNNFLASGGDGYTVLTEGKVIADGGLDLDALEAWLKPGRTVPKLGRTRNLSPR